MPLKSETTDILGYYDDSWWTPKTEGVTRSFAMALSDMIDRIGLPLERWPVRNREDRTPINSQKRAIIHLRDGDICKFCGTDSALLTVDHIIPRSAFPADQLEIADRSDNLISACWPCNEAKSNFERDQRKRLGVVAACWYCKAPELGDDGQLPCPVNTLVFCGRCGVSHVPDIEGWVL